MQLLKQRVLKQTPKLLLLTCLVMIGVVVSWPKTVQAAGPNLINFQGKVVRNDAGNIGINVADASYTFRFCLYSTATPATPCTAGANNDALWKESKSLSTVNGVFQTELGDVTTLPDFNANTALYLGVNFNADAAGELTPRIHLDSVPWARSADNAIHVDAATSNGALGIGDTNAGAMTIGNVTNSSFLFRAKQVAAALQVQNASGNELLTIDTSATEANNLVRFGKASTISGRIVFNNATNTNTVTIVSGVTSASSYTLTLPTALPGSTQCLQSTTGGVLSFASCGGGSSTLATTYANGASQTDSTITLDSTRLGIIIQDAASPISGNLFTVQKNAGSAQSYFAVTASAVTLQDTAGNNALVFDSTTSELKIYDNSASPTNFASITATGSSATFKSNSGTTILGNGSGDITLSTTNIGDVVIYTHTGSGATTDIDFLISRNITGGSSTLAHSVLKVEDLSTTSGTDNPDLLLINQNNGSATGNLINAQLAASTKFQVNTGGTVTIAASQSYTGAGAVTLSSAAASILTVDSGTTGGLNIGGGANAKAIAIGNSQSGTTVAITSGAVVETHSNTGVTIQTNTNSTTAFQVQNAIGSNALSVNTIPLNTILTNPSFEGTDVSTWVYLGTPGSVARVITQAYRGNASLRVITTANASNGVKFVTGNGGSALATLTTYTISWYDLLDSASLAFNDVRAVYARDGATEVACTGQTVRMVISSGWVRHSCQIATDGTGPAATAYIALEQAVGAVHTFYIDAVQIEATTVASVYKETGITLDGVVTSTVALKDDINNVNAFTVQNSGGINLLNIDTLSSGISFSDPNNKTIFNVNMLSATNVITNPNFENANGVSPPGWAKLQGAETTFLTDNAVAGTSHDGGESLKIVTVAATANQGAKYVYQFTPNTTYIFSVWASVGTGGTSFATFDMGTVQNAGAQTTCLSAQTLTTVTQQFNCTFTTGGTIQATDYVFVRDSSTTSHTFYLDTVVLQATNSGFVNLVGNPSLESGNTNGWAVKGATATSIAVSTDAFNTGNRSLKVVTGTAAQQGAQYSMPLLANTQYSFSLWARKDAGSAASFFLGRQDVSGTNVDCATNYTLTTTWTQMSCTFTTGGTITVPTIIYLSQGADTTSDTLYIDGVTFVQASTGLAFSEPADGIQVDSQLSNIILNGDNSGELQPWKLNATTIGCGNREQAGTAHANGYLYVIGGTTDGTAANTQTSVCYAKINADGSLGAWNTTTVLPAARRLLTTTVANGYMYAIGGQDTASAIQATVYYSKLNGDGTIGTWQTNKAALPAVRAGAVSRVNNGIMYVAGGCSAISDTPACTTNAVTTIYYAKVNADGSITGITTNNTWNTTTAALTFGRGLGSIIVANGFLYYIGGSGAANGTPAAAGAKQDVYFAPIVSSGDITTAFTTTTILPNARLEHTSIVANGYVYVIGGCSTSASVTTASCNAGAVSTVYYARLNADGTLSSWITNPSPLPAVRSAHVTMIINSYIYALGGYDGSARHATVFYASTSRVLIAGGLDLVGLSGQALSDFSGGGSLTAGNTRVIGDLRVDGYADFNNGISVDSAINLNAVSASPGQVVFNVNNSSSNSIFSVRHMGANFGSLANAGAFIGNVSQFSEEFNADLANCAVDCLTMGDSGQWYIDVLTTCTASQAAGNLNGFLRIALTATTTACLTAPGNTQNVSQKIFQVGNLPVFQIKLRISNTAATSDAFSGLMDFQAAVATNDTKPANGLYFWGNNTTTGWVGEARNASGTPTALTACGGTISTTQFAVLRIEVLTSTSVRFLADSNASDGVNLVDCGTITSAQIPAAATALSSVIYGIQTAAATNNIDVDYVRVWQDDAPSAAAADAAASSTPAQVNQSLLTTPPVTPDSSSLTDKIGLIDFTTATTEDTIINGNVYIRGTLFADKIKANQIEGLEVITNSLGSLQERLAAATTSTNQTGNSSVSNLNTLTMQSATVTLDLDVKGSIKVGGTAEFRGNAFFYSLVTFVDKTIFKSDVTFAAHVTTSGNVPTVTTEDAAGITNAPADNPSANLASAKVDGNDNSGQLTVDIGDNSTTGKLVTLNFDKPFSKAPRVMITPVNGATAQVRYYVASTPTGFAIIMIDPPTSGTTLTFNYWVVQ